VMACNHSMASRSSIAARPSGSNGWKPEFVEILVTLEQVCLTARSIRPQPGSAHWTHQSDCRSPPFPL
jgi:hypothetical protein